jgi:hypothetical protein
MEDLNAACNALQNIFELWGVYLKSNGQSRSSEDFYLDHVTPAFLAADLNSSLFDERKFPALKDLGIDLKPAKAAVSESFLPEAWEPALVKENVADNPLAQFLLAYIWKLGKFPEVSNVMAGYRTPAAQDEGQVDENAVVMRQFGRHLASPSIEPIYDQHTARFLKIHEGMLLSPPSLFTDLLASSVDQLSSMADRERYVAWWRASILAGMAPDDQLWADRIMFSLGKAAKKLGGRLLKARKGGGSTSHPQSKLALAQELVARNPALPVAQMRPLLMARLEISKDCANTYFYIARRRLG